MDLVDIKSEASRLKKGGKSGSTAGSSKTDGSSAEEQLKVLQKKLERGAISEEEYQKEKKKVLEEFLKK
jgi:uncharacterized membrane protein